MARRVRIRKPAVSGTSSILLNTGNTIEFSNSIQALNPFNDRVVKITRAENTRAEINLGQITMAGVRRDEY